MQEVITIVKIEDVRSLAKHSEGYDRFLGYEHQVLVSVFGRSTWLDVGFQADPTALLGSVQPTRPPTEHPYTVGDWALIKHPEVPATVLRKLTKDNVGESWFI